MNYLLDAYTIYAASVLAANSVLRSMFGFAFPLFTNYMYQNLGIHWASSIPAFLALACVPAPFLFYRYGAPIRRAQKYSREAEEVMKKILEAEGIKSGAKAEGDSGESSGEEKDVGHGEKMGKESKGLEDRAAARYDSRKERGRGRDRLSKEVEGNERREGGGVVKKETRKLQRERPRASLIGADEDVDLEKGLVD